MFHIGSLCFEIPFQMSYIKAFTKALFRSAEIYRHIWNFSMFSEKTILFPYNRMDFPYYVCRCIPCNHSNWMKFTLLISINFKSRSHCHCRFHRKSSSAFWWFVIHSPHFRTFTMFQQDLMQFWCICTVHVHGNLFIALHNGREWKKNIGKNAMKIRL